MVKTEMGLRQLLRRCYPNTQCTRSPFSADGVHHIFVLTAPMNVASHAAEYRQRHINLDGADYWTAVLPEPAGPDESTYDRCIQKVLEQSPYIAARLQAYAVRDKEVGHSMHTPRTRPVWLRTCTFAAVESLSEYVYSRTQSVIGSSLTTPAVGTLQDMEHLYPPFNPKDGTNNAYTNNLSLFGLDVLKKPTKRVFVTFISREPIHELEFIKITPHAYRILGKGTIFGDDTDVGGCYKTVVAVGDTHTTSATTRMVHILEDLTRAVLQNVLYPDMSTSDVFFADLSNYPSLIPFQRDGLVEDSGTVKPVLVLMTDLWSAGAPISEVLATIDNYKAEERVVDMGQLPIVDHY